MKKIFLPFCFCLSLLFLAEAAAAQVILPQASPEALVKQTIGLTDITVRYHAPGVRGRKVFGDLVPYGKIWRAGANEATLITFQDDVFFNHERVPSGTYSFFIIPENDKSWNIVLNKDTTLWGLDGYDELNDVAYFTATPQKNSFTETLQFSFSDLGANKGVLNLAWENLKVSVQLETEVEKKALANINAALAKAAPDDWYVWAQCAEYLLPYNQQHQKALEWINKSITIKENFYNNWVKARLYAKNKEFQMASSLTAKAMQLGSAEPDNYQTYAKEIESAYNEWKKRKL